MCVHKYEPVVYSQIYVLVITEIVFVYNQRITMKTIRNLIFQKILDVINDITMGVLTFYTVDCFLMCLQAEVGNQVIEEKQLRSGGLERNLKD